MCDESSDSDFDDEEDPDEVQVPGGGKDFATAVGFTGKKKEPIDLSVTLKAEPKIKTQINSIVNINSVHEEEEVEDEEMIIADTYADYMPRKLNLGSRHPDPVVETASLSSVDPVDVWYKLSIPDETIKSCALSALQLESITYACQRHEYLLPDKSRAGFLIGDGAGVGKGRTIAGIIYENYLKGRKKSIWISASNDLKYDAQRDLADIGASRIHVHSLSKFKYEKISADLNGNVKKGVIFSTYSALIGESTSNGGKYKSRLKQLLQWCGENFDGLIVFDECHRAKNLCPTGSSKPTKTGLSVLELQNKLRNARIVYASATGASEPKNMAYMTRLGMWGDGTTFSRFNDFITAVEKRGVGAMEIVAMDMKLRGAYIARQLSFQGVSFKIEEVSFQDDFKNIYDQAVELWVEAMKKFQVASELIDAENRMKKTMWGQFWSSHQRFFKYLCIGAKVKHTVSVAHEAIKCGKCVVIGLQSTGEARTLEQLEREDGEISDFVSTAKGVLQSLVEKYFPAPDRDRIQRVLGFHLPQETTSQVHSVNFMDNDFVSNSKRKFAPNAVQSQSKKVRNQSFPEKINKENNIEPRSSALLDLEINSSGSEDELNSEKEASDNESDYNPFDSDSNSDLDPWDRRAKKNADKPNDKTVVKTNDKSVVKQNFDRPIDKSVNKQQEKLEKTPFSFQHKIQDIKENIKVNRHDMQPNVTTATKIGGESSQIAIERTCMMKKELLEKIEKLGKKLPANALDQLIDELGGPDNVAEMTGRKGRVVQSDDGTIHYELRAEADIPLETLNLAEKQRFMDSEKMVAIISEVASSGISLQSDRRVRNQKRRVHITLELPWSADRAIQQFGRTHRSNQVNAPEYIFLISDLAGERRFASVVAKRLESLGALTHGDRRATEIRDLSQFNIDTKYGRMALETTMKTIIGFESPLVKPPQDYPGDFFKDIANALAGVGLICFSQNTSGVPLLDKDYNSISKFLNRLLGVPVDLQNCLFKYFTDTLNAIVQQAKRIGHFDMGIMDLGASGRSVRSVHLFRFLQKHATGLAPTELHIVQVERGMNWSEAMELLSKATNKQDGFYISRQLHNYKQLALLAISSNNKTDFRKDDLYMVYRPNTGLQLRQETLKQLNEKYKKVSSEEAKLHWINQYNASADTCSHIYWSSHNKNSCNNRDCEVGRRQKSYNVLAGSVLSIWNRVESVLATRSGQNYKVQVVRLRTVDGLKIVGTLIPKSCFKLMYDVLASDAEKVEERSFAQ